MLDKLPEFRKLGWMTEDASRVYEQALKNGDSRRILQRIAQDLKEQQITSEVVALFESLR